MDRESVTINEPAREKTRIATVRKIHAAGLLLWILFSFVASASDTVLTIETRNLAKLPKPVSNNTVAVLETENGPLIFSFLGLGPAKSWKSIQREAFSLSIENQTWKRLMPVPGSIGRLASTAIAVNSRIIIFGGYTVAKDGTEVSVPAVHRYDPATDSYEPLPDMPVPVDDAVSLPYLDRYVYLISGWHDDGNVNLVQVLDLKERRWFQATPYPGSPVFGHSGGIAGRQLIVCDGVKIVVSNVRRRQYAATNECYSGTIDADNPRRIRWHSVPPHPGKPRYRMAATGVSEPIPATIFVGGSITPYNYNGTGYDGNPAEPSSLVLRFRFDTKSWETVGHLDTATMDHRGLLKAGSGFVIAGGMRSKQIVSDEVLYFELP